MDIVTVTLNPTIDATCSVDRVVPDKKLRCTRPRYAPGGGGINVARAIRRLGGRARALWSSGGHMGELLYELLDQEGVPHTPIAISDMTRENLIVFEETSGEQYRFGMPGPTLTQEEAGAWLAALARLDPAPAYLVLSGSLPPGVADDFYVRLCERAPSATRVVLDASGPALRKSLEAGMFLVKPNIGELADIVGRPLQGDAEVEAVARQFIDRGGSRAILVSLGQGGAILVTRDGMEHIRAPIVPVASRVGAGDSMVAGTIYALARGKSLVDAAMFGVAAGTAAVMTPGTELCRRDDTERLHAEIKRCMSKRS